MATHGHIDGSVAAPRGLLEFFADPTTPATKTRSTPPDGQIVICASGARASLATLTLRTMGYENVAVLIAKGFTEFGVQRVVASTMAVNTASRRVMEKSGMRLVRAFVADWPVSIPGDEHGDVEYAITRDEWAADDSRLRPQ